MTVAFCVDCGLHLTGWYCGACGRDYGATDAAQRASCPLATSQQDSSSTAGAQRAVSPTSRPCAREGGGRAHGDPRSLSAPAATRGRGPGGAGAGPSAGGVAPAGGFTLSKNITSWRDGPMGRFVKPMSAAAASDGPESIEEARSARDAQFSTKLSATLTKQRDESAGIKARITLASEF